MLDTFIAFLADSLLSMVGPFAYAILLWLYNLLGLIQMSA